MYKSCWNCKDRIVGCHSNCERYIKEKEIDAREKEATNRAKKTKNALVSMGIERTLRARKRLGIM